MKEKNKQFQENYKDVLLKTQYPKKEPKKWDRFNNCCSQERVRIRCKCGCDMKIYFSRCKLPFCPICGKIESLKRFREALVIARFLQWEQPKERPLYIYFFTFTIVTGKDLLIQLKKLIKSLRRFKNKYRWWIKFCLAGFQSIEVTQSNGKWHVHCHMVVLSEVEWIDKEDLKKMKRYWLNITGDSDVIYVNKVKDVEDCKDVFKYALKHDGVDKKGLYEFAIATSRVRLYSKIGKAYNYGNDKSKELRQKLQKVIEGYYKTSVSEGTTLCPKCYEPADWEFFEQKPTYEQTKRHFTGGIREYTITDAKGHMDFMDEHTKEILERHFFPEQVITSMTTNNLMNKKSISQVQDITKDVILE